MRRSPLASGERQRRGPSLGVREVAARERVDPAQQPGGRRAARRRAREGGRRLRGGAAVHLDDLRAERERVRLRLAEERAEPGLARADHDPPAGAAEPDAQRDLGQARRRGHEQVTVLERAEAGPDPVEEAERLVLPVDRPLGRGAARRAARRGSNAAPEQRGLLVEEDVPRAHRLAQLARGADAIPRRAQRDARARRLLPAAPRSRRTGPPAPAAPSGRAGPARRAGRPAGRGSRGGPRGRGRGSCGIGRASGPCAGAPDCVRVLTNRRGDSTIPARSHRGCVQVRLVRRAPTRRPGTLATAVTRRTAGARPGTPRPAPAAPPPSAPRPSPRASSRSRRPVRGSGCS